MNMKDKKIKAALAILDGALKCPCFVKLQGTDGTSNCTEPSGRVFETNISGRIKVMPCENHLSLYLKTSLFKEIE